MSPRLGTELVRVDTPGRLHVRQGSTWRLVSEYDEFSVIPTTPDLLTRPDLVTVSGFPADTRYRPTRANDRTWDGRSVSVEQFAETYTILLDLGDVERIAWVGGLVNGTQPVDDEEIIPGIQEGVQNPLAKTHRWWKNSHDGTSFQIQRASDWFVFDGIRGYNVQDGVRPSAPASGPPFPASKYRLSNFWFENIHDDSIETFPQGGLIEDGLVDGAFVFLSGPDAGGLITGERLIVRRCLARVMMHPEIRDGQDDGAPYVDGTIINGNGAHGIWKDVDPLSLQPAHVEDCIFLQPWKPCVQPEFWLSWPSSWTYRNVHLIWLGEGVYPMPLPNGVTLHTGVDGWNLWLAGKAAWKAAHGLASSHLITDAITDWNSYLNPDPDWFRSVGA